MTPPCLQMKTPRVQQGLVFSLISRLGVQCSGIFLLIPSSHPPKPPSLLSSKRSQVGGKHFLSIAEHSRSSTENLVQQTRCEFMEPLVSPAGCTPLYTGQHSLRSSLLFPMPTQGEGGLIIVLGAHRGGLQGPSLVLSKRGQGWVWNRWKPRILRDSSPHHWAPGHVSRRTDAMALWESCLHPLSFLPLVNSPESGLS